MVASDETAEGTDLEGTLVKLPGGREWDVLTSKGHAGLTGIFQDLKGKRVRLVVGPEVEALPQADEVATDEICVTLDAVGPALADALWDAGIETVSDLAGAPDDELLAVSGLGPKTLAQIREELGQGGEA
jgi:hypothetical protein